MTATRSSVHARRHDDLRAWLDLVYGVSTRESHGRLVTGDLDALLCAARASYRLDQTDHAALTAARTAYLDLMAKTRAGAQTSLVGPDLDRLLVEHADVPRVLAAVCASLSAVDVIAVPLTEETVTRGIVHGGEVLLGQVSILGTGGLYERLRVEQRPA